MQIFSWKRVAMFLGASFWLFVGGAAPSLAIDCTGQCLSGSCPDGTDQKSEVCPSGQVCCVDKLQPAGTSGVVGMQCTANPGYYCAADCNPGDQGMGVIDCPAATAGGATVQQKCCAPKTSPTESGSTAGASGGGGAITLYGQLPDSVKKCFQTGNCQLDDIIRTGTTFANVLMQLSAVAFFATFVYGGGMYLLSFGRSDWVSTGKKAMYGAATGMLFVLGAWTIVNYLALSITGKAP